MGRAYTGVNYCWFLFLFCRLHMNWLNTLILIIYRFFNFKLEIVSGQEIASCEMGSSDSTNSASNTEYGHGDAILVWHCWIRFSGKWVLQRLRWINGTNIRFSGERSLFERQSISCCNNKVFGIFTYSVGRLFTGVSFGAFSFDFAVGTCIAKTWKPHSINNTTFSFQTRREGRWHCTPAWLNYANITTLVWA